MTPTKQVPWWPTGPLLFVMCPTHNTRRHHIIRGEGRYQHWTLGMDSSHNFLVGSSRSHLDLRMPGVLCYFNLQKGMFQLLLIGWPIVHAMEGNTWSMVEMGLSTTQLPRLRAQACLAKTHLFPHCCFCLSCPPPLQLPLTQHRAGQTFCTRTLLEEFCSLKTCSLNGEKPAYHVWALGSFSGVPHCSTVNDCGPFEPERKKSCCGLIYSLQESLEFHNSSFPGQNLNVQRTNLVSLNSKEMKAVLSLMASLSSHEMEIPLHQLI